MGAKVPVSREGITVASTWRETVSHVVATAAGAVETHVSRGAMGAAYLPSSLNLAGTLSPRNPSAQRASTGRRILWLHRGRVVTRRDWRARLGRSRWRRRAARRRSQRILEGERRKRPRGRRQFR